MSRVSVLIPNYQSKQWISRTLESCLSQQDLLEIIVIDDFSTDGSMDLLSYFQSAYPDKIKVYPNIVKGGNNARNLAFSYSKGDYIQWLDADDQLLEGKFQHQLQSFDQHSEVDIVYSDWELVTYTNDQAVRKEFKEQQPHEDFIQELLFDHWSPPHSYLIKRNLATLLDKIQAWNPDTAVGQDREYFTLAAILGGRFLYRNGNYARYNRWSRQSVSASASEKRFASVSRMLDRFELAIANRKEISGTKKEAYQQIINTEKILLRALGYPASIINGSVSVRSVYWQRVKGVRTRLKFFRELIKALR